MNRHFKTIPPLTEIGVFLATEYYFENNLKVFIIIHQDSPLPITMFNKSKVQAGDFSLLVNP